jgi:hypothetical protein
MGGEIHQQPQQAASLQPVSLTLGKNKSLTVKDLQKCFGKTGPGRKWNHIKLAFRKGIWVKNKDVAKLLGKMSFKQLEAIENQYNTAISNKTKQGKGIGKLLSRLSITKKSGPTAQKSDEFKEILGKAKTLRQHKEEETAKQIIAKNKEYLKYSDEFKNYLSEQGHPDDVLQWISHENLEMVLGQFEKHIEKSYAESIKNGESVSTLKDLPLRRELHNAFKQVGTFAEEMRNLGIFDQRSLSEKNDSKLLAKLGRECQRLDENKKKEVLDIASEVFEVKIENITDFKNIIRVKTGAADSHQIAQDSEKVKKAQNIILDVISNTKISHESTPKEKSVEYFMKLSKLDARLQEAGLLPKTGDADKILYLQAYLLSNSAVFSKLEKFVEGGNVALKLVSDVDFNELTMIEDGRGHGMNQRLSPMFNNFREGLTV